MKIIAGSASKNLGKSVALKLEISVSNANITKYSDGETNVEVASDLGGHEVFIIQAISPPANDNLIEALLIADAVKRVGAKRAILVVPYYGYSRQDRVIKNGKMHSALSAKLVASLIKAADVDSIITVDLHSHQIEGFFDIPIRNLSAFEVFATRSVKLENAVIVAPDVGALSRARNFAKVLLNQYKINLIDRIAVIDKYREKAGTSEVMQVIGEVRDKDCIIVDDIVDSAGTLCNAAFALRERGAKSVVAYITHGVLSGNALDKISSSALDKLVITDTISHNNDLCDKIEIMSITDTLVKAINSYGGKIET
ncbi:MAG: ribose-phosphate pyrophosphokinase [Candidatus Mesenet longicola]|uniref:ribose-phosphate diphosphokinase n=1 Tax=Candidatus Mesenet longicola TaxID=1892558 RepID=A0A8J3HXV1_9RICK|nr:MAG: ribose-phosphate pyrophosphokinase [Candidatus Mesenet longicola]GHM59551.1 MAG: ribose-phosphate pyrophosphokinase [Candidatus Mesenet longicola]